MPANTTIWGPELTKYLSISAKNIGSIYALLGMRHEGAYNVLSFYAGLNKGGGLFYWDASCDKATANGGTIIDPDSIGGFDGTPSSRDGFLGAQGAGIGTGCFVRVLNESQTVSPEMFGAVGDGVEDDTVALQSWIAADHSTKECVGSFKTTDFLELQSGFHAVFDAHFLPEIDHGLNEYWSQFQGVFTANGTVTEDSSLLTADVTIGDSVIQVADASGFSAGDHIVITQDEHPSPTGYEDYRDHWVDTFCKILSIDGNSLELSTYMAHPFKLSLQAKVEKVIPVTDVSLLGNITFDMTYQSDRVCGTHFQYASGVRIGNLSILTGGGGRGFQFGRCFDVRCGVLSRDNPADAGAGNGYTMSFLASNNCYLEEARGFRGVRRVFDASTGTFNVKVGKVLCVKSRSAATGHGMNTCDIEVESVVSVDSTGAAVSLGNATFHGDHDWIVGNVVVRGRRTTDSGSVYTGASRNLRIGTIDIQDCTGNGAIRHGGGSKGLYVGSVYARNILDSVIDADGAGAEDFHIGRLVVEGSCANVVRVTSGYGKGVVIDWMDTRRAEPSVRVILIRESPAGEPRKVVDLHIRGGHIGSLNSAAPVYQHGAGDTARSGIHISDCVLYGTPSTTLSAGESLFLRGNTFIDTRPIVQHITKNFTYVGNLSQGAPDIPTDNGVDIIVSGNGRYI